MGRRVCRLLAEWTPAARVVGAARAGAERALDLGDEASAAGALEGVTLLVNAAGPYAYDPGPVVRACVGRGVHYVDLADDAAWFAALDRVVAACGPAAHEVAIVPGCSTVPGLVAVLASRWAGRSDVAALSAFLSMGSANPPSRGLLGGLLAPLGRPRPGGGRWFTERVTATATDGRTLQFGAWPVPGEGIALGARRVPLRFFAGFDRAWITALLRGVAPVLGRLPRSWTPALAGLALPLVRLARPFGTPLGVLLLRAEDAQARELDRVELAAAANGLDVPAAPVVWVVERLLAGARLGGGRVGLEALVDASDAEAWLQRAGYALREGSGSTAS